MLVYVLMFLGIKSLVSYTLFQHQISPRSILLLTLSLAQRAKQGITQQLYLLTNQGSALLLFQYKTPLQQRNQFPYSYYTLYSMQASLRLLYLTKAPSLSQTFRISFIHKLEQNSSSLQQITLRLIAKQKSLISTLISVYVYILTTTRTTRTSRCLQLTINNLPYSIRLLSSRCL